MCAVGSVYYAPPKIGEGGHTKRNYEYEALIRGLSTPEDVMML